MAPEQKYKLCGKAATAHIISSDVLSVDQARTCLFNLLSQVPNTVLGILLVFHECRMKSTDKDTETF